MRVWGYEEILRLPKNLKTLARTPFGGILRILSLSPGSSVLSFLQFLPSLSPVLGPALLGLEASLHRLHSSVT